MHLKKGVMNHAPTSNGGLRPPFLLVRQAWRVARKRNLVGCGDQLSDLEVEVLYTPGKGKC